MNLELNNAKDHTGSKEYQADSDDAHRDQRNGDDLFKEDRVFWHMRFTF